MPLLLSDLRALVRSETGNDDDTQYTDTQIGTWFWVEYGKLHTKLSAKFPHLFETTSSETVLTGATSTIAKPSDLRKVVRVERQNAEGSWQAVPHASKVNPQLDLYIGYTERGANIELTPAGTVAGTYRIIYVKVPSETFPADDLPRGVEDVLIQKVIAKAQIRLGGDPSPHIQEADRTYNDFVKAYKSSMRGNAPEPGMVEGYGAAVFYDEDWP